MANNAAINKIIQIQGVPQLVFFKKYYFTLLSAKSSIPLNPLPLPSSFSK